MRTLELFSGTQSFSTIIEADTKITVDILNKFNPTHVVDILEWDYTIYPTNYFDVLWCSPPCTEYSKAKTHGERNLPHADRCVRKCFEIIDYFQPRVWILENPATGLLPGRIDLLRPGLGEPCIADYCAYGKPYRKRTAFWSNIPLTLERCAGVARCPSMNGTKHIGSCGNGTNKYNSVGVNSVWDKDSIPEGLIQHIIGHL